MKKIIKFYKSNKIISNFFFVAFICTISYILTLDKPEIKPGIEKWYNLLFQLSVGYIINFFFYVTQVYLPEEKRMSSINKCIFKKLETLSHDMIDPFNYMSELYLDKSKNIFTEEQIRLMWDKLNLNDNLSRLHSLTFKPFKFRELFLDDMHRIVSTKDTIFLYYSSYLTDDLISILEEITDSNYFKIMEAICSIPTNSINPELSKYLIEFYNLYIKLNKIKESYK
ncbi:hypothetical protein [uncultured Clostridium sp.]|uniref:hypothetical protein n=1 Tax=uncultured Clostridium sp. TaxID=59620 RepID=UPI0025CD64F2|nr:hypothetical protein [uncultured Clostridium sp.]